RDLSVVRKISPHQTGTLLCLQGGEPQSRSEFGLRGLACWNRDALPGVVVAPSVIRASQRPVHHLAETQLRAAVQTSIIVHAHFSGRVAPHDDVASETRQSNRLVLHMRRLTDRIPHV